MRLVAININVPFQEQIAMTVYIYIIQAVSGTVLSQNVTIKKIGRPVRHESHHPHMTQQFCCGLFNLHDLVILSL